MWSFFQKTKANFCFLNFFFFLHNFTEKYQAKWWLTSRVRWSRKVRDFITLCRTACSLSWLTCLFPENCWEKKRSLLINVQIEMQLRANTREKLFYLCLVASSRSRDVVCCILSRLRKVRPISGGRKLGLSLKVESFLATEVWWKVGSFQPKILFLQSQWARFIQVFFFNSGDKFAMIY